MLFNMELTEANVAKFMSLPKWRQKALKKAWGIQFKLCQLKDWWIDCDAVSIKFKILDVFSGGALQESIRSISYLLTCMESTMETIAYDYKTHGENLAFKNQAREMQEYIELMDKPIRNMLSCKKMED